MKGVPNLMNRESLALYRDILRAARVFTWNNAAGQPWRGLLIANARKEFEQARLENDPLVVARLLFVGRDCLNQTKDKLAGAVQAMKDNIDRTRTK
jgi:hypothetical protein